MATPVKRITINDIREMKQNGEKLAMLTAYDYPTAKIIDSCNIPIILVGDSLGNGGSGLRKHFTGNYGCDDSPLQSRRPGH